VRKLLFLTTIGDSSGDLLYDDDDEEEELSANKKEESDGIELTLVGKP